MGTGVNGESGEKGRGWHDAPRLREMMIKKSLYIIDLQTCVLLRVNP